MPDMTQENKLKFMQASIPRLVSGKYVIRAEQKVSEPSVQSFAPIENVFYVSTPKFSVNSELVYSVFPHPGDCTESGNTLPHIVFDRKTLPWERDIKGSENARSHNVRGLDNSGEKPDTTPWFALLCLNESETPEIQIQTIADFVKATDEKVFHPKYIYDETTGEALDAECRFIDLDVGTFRELMPTKEELGYLSHVRIVDMHDKEDKLIPHDGYFSVLIGNRFPTSTLTGETNTVFLVSVEGYEEVLPGGSKEAVLEQFEKIRLISLYNWKFESKKREYAGFRALMEGIDTNVFTASPFIEERQDSDAAYILNKGYMPMKHITRTGETTVSLYRGPLCPYQVELNAENECNTADGEIIYDPNLGMFDMSYAAAWQLGRLLSLNNKAIAKEIYKWRRSETKKVYLKQSKFMLNNNLSRLSEDTEKDGDDNTVQEAYVEVLFKRLLADMDSKDGFIPNTMETL